MKLSPTQKKLQILGIVTVEDVIEQIFNLEIMEEEDYKKSKRSKWTKIDSNLSSSWILAFYTNPEVKETFIKETMNEIKGIIKGVKNNVEMKEKIMNQIEINKDDKKKVF